MTQMKKFETKNISRGKFLRFLGKVGALSLLTTIPVFGAESKLKQVPKEGASASKLSFRTLSYRDILHGPTMKGRTLSKEVLEGKLQTKNLENIRDLLTGRFFGKAAEDAFKGGYVPLINWGLDKGENGSGCFLLVNFGEDHLAGNPCTIKVNAIEDGDKIAINIVSTSYEASLKEKFGGACALVLDCPGECSGKDPCPSQCADKCSGTYCSGSYCSPKGEIDLREIVSYPADKFASEIMAILETSDVGLIQKELKNIIFSDQVLNMGLQHVVLAVHDGITADVETGRFAH